MATKQFLCIIGLVFFVHIFNCIFFMALGAKLDLILKTLAGAGNKER